MLPLLVLILTHFLYFGAEFHVEKECIVWVCRALTAHNAFTKSVVFFFSLKS